MDYYVSKNYKKDFSHFNTINECLNIASEGSVIYLSNEEYFEKIYIKIPNLKLIGDNSTICYDAYNGLIMPNSFGGDGIKTWGTTGSASVTVCEEALNFIASDIVFKNSFIPNQGIKGTQAVALKVLSNNSVFNNCKFISTQDTLYPDLSNKIIFNNCYIEGNIDFIFGSANALFNNCEIVAIDLGKDAYFIAPDTFVQNEYGLCFYNCNFKMDGNNKVYLGRPWFPSTSNYPVYPRALFYKSTFSNNILLEYVFMKKDDIKEIDGMHIYQCIHKNRLVSDVDITKIDKIITWIISLKQV